MEYRSYGRGSEKFSVIGMGGEHWVELTDEQIAEIIEYGLSHGVNIIDLFMAQPCVRKAIGKAIQGRREQVMIQGHFGSTWQNGQYARSRDLDTCKHAFDDLLTYVQTDYIDFGMIHYVDSAEDADKVFASGCFDEMLRMREQGVIRHIGLSSHNPEIAARFVQTGEIDALLFSINPAYDMVPDYTDDIDALIGFKTLQTGRLSVAPTRAALYQLCAQKGVAITVMKALGAGMLMNAKLSPFGLPLSVPQCVQYALDRPAVTSVLLGTHKLEELKADLAFFDTTPAERDYSQLMTVGRFEANGLCMYCNHCLPCPANIDIAAVNKFLDLATLGGEVPESVRQHYLSLTHNAKDCLMCGSCEKNCPFAVDVRSRMRRAQEIFD